MAGLGHDFHNVAGVQFVAQRHHAAVNFGTHASVTNLSVDGVGEIDGRGITGKNHNFSFGREGVDLFRVEIHLERRKEFSGITDVALPLHHLTQPCKALLVLRGDRAVFVFPVRGDALLGHLVHFLGTDLDFKRGAVFRDH